MKEISSSYKRGQKDWHNGKFWQDCPYKKNTKRAKDWFNGWCDVSETFTLNKYFIPNISKNDLKERLKQLSLVKERKLGDTTKDEEQKADVIGLEYIKNIEASKKSDDLGNALFLFAKSVYNYDEMSNILPPVRLLQREIEKTSYIQGSDPNITKTGKDSNMWKIVDG